MICPYCGFQNNEKAVFCSNCGKSFSDNLNEVGFEKRTPALPRNKLRPCLIIVSGIIFLCLGVIILGVLAASRSNLFNQPLSEEILQQTNEISTTTFQDSTNEAQIENVSPSPTNVPLQETPTFESFTAFTATELYPGYDPNDPYAGPIPEGALFRIGRGKINDCAISPDENEIILATDLGVYIYDYESFELIWFYETESTCTEVIHHPVQNLFAAGLGDGGILLFDREKKELIKTLVGHEYGSINELSFSPDGKYLASSAHYGNILIFNIQSGEIVNKFEGGNFEISPDWNWIIYQYGINLILADLKSGREIMVLEENPENFYFSFAIDFAPDGEYLAVADSSFPVAIWNLKTLIKEVVFDSSSERIDSLMYSPDGSSLLACMADGTLKIFDSTNGNVKNSFDTDIETFYYKNGLAVFSDWKTILLPYGDGQIMLLDLQLGQIKELIPENYQEIKSIQFFKNETQVLIFFSEMIISLDFQTGQIINQLNGHPQGFADLSYSLQDNTLSMLISGKTIKVWGIEQMDWLSTTEIKDKSKISLVLSPANELQVVEYLENSINIWDVLSGELVQTFYGDLHSLSYIPSTNYILIYEGRGNPTVSKRDVSNGEKIFTFEEYISTFISTSDGKLLVSGQGSSPIQLWDSQTGNLILTYESNAYSSLIIGAKEFSFDNQILATENNADEIILWGTETGEIIRVITGLNNNVYYHHGISFSSTGPFLATIFDEQFVGIWNYETGERVAVFADGNHAYYAYQFINDGNVLVLNGEGTILFWDISEYVD